MKLWFAVLFFSCFFHEFLYLDFVDILSILGRLLGAVFEHCVIILAFFFRCRFSFEFIQIFGSILACFFKDFLILFLHSLENVDFIKIAVFLQENNVFHGSEGSKILYLSLFFQAFLSKDFGFDFSLIS